MFKLTTKLPGSKLFVAVSGGPDSMAALDFLRRTRYVTALHFNHGTVHGADAEKFVTEVTKQMGITLIVSRLLVEVPKGESKEKFWRDHRYNFFSSVLRGDSSLVTAHTLDDAMETWVFTAMQGNPRLIPAQRGNIIRPFLAARKKDMLDWCVRHNVPFILDPSNEDLNHPRCRIRNVILPELLKINPGLPKVIAKKYFRQA